MSNEVIKHSRELKGSLANVRAHLSAIEHAGDLLLATIKRAEADYAERVTRATAAMTGIESELSTATGNGQPQPAEEQPQAAEPTQ